MNEMLYTFRAQSPELVQRKEFYAIVHQFKISGFKLQTLGFKNKERSGSQLKKIHQSFMMALKVQII